MYEQAPRPEPRSGPSSKKYNQRLGNLGRYAEIAGVGATFRGVGQEDEFEGVEAWIDMLKLPSEARVDPFGKEIYSKAWKPGSNA